MQKPDPLSLITDLIANARKAGADAADALMYTSTSISVSQRLGKPEGLERSESNGVGLRVFVGEQPSVVSSSDTSPEALKELISRAVMMAKLAPVDPYSSLAPAELLAVSIPELDLYDPVEPDATWLQAQCARAEETALASKGITNSEGADASYGATHFLLATSNGFARGFSTSNASLSVVVLAGEGTGMERDYDFTSARHVADLEAAETIGANAAKRALARHDPRKVSTQQVPIVFDPRVGKGIISAFASAINGNAIARGTSFLKDAMGKAIFSPAVTIIDDPLRKRGLGSRPFDGEGVACRKTVLIDKGALQTWLLDMRSANQLKLQTTGSASRGLSSPPSPSTTNVYMQPGAISPQELMADIQSGFYVTDVFGMGVNMVTGDYSQGAAGFWIEKGQIAYPVSEVTIAGKLQEMFLHITPANDLRFHYATNAPTLRIEGMMVAGK
jgi:PmbA protein